MNYSTYQPLSNYEFIAECKNLINGKTFKKGFSSYYAISSFVRKCKYSKKIRIIKIDDKYNRGYTYNE